MLNERLLTRPAFLTGLVLGLVVPASRRDETPLRAPTLYQQEAADTSHVVLAEVLSAPKEGDTAFVELLNAGKAPVRLETMVLKIDTLELPLPRLAAPLAPGARALIRFDGRAGEEGNVIHASTTYELHVEGGVVRLVRNDDLELDRVAWGSAPNAVAAPGFSLEATERGSSLGRPPGANGRSATWDWVTYPPDQVTPGERNPLPPVAQLLPLSGTMLEQLKAELAWYPVPGAARYQIQLDHDSIFAEPRLNRSVAEPRTSSGPLPAGHYWWRVQAIDAEGHSSSWSRPSQLELGAVDAVAPPDGFEVGGGLRADASERGGSPAPLNVPFLSQNKDTQMLLLESPNRTGPHAWNVDHRVLLFGDLADTWNCALANVAMINRFYNGNLSQDRIGYEVLSRNVARYVPVIAASPYSVGLVNGQIQERAPGPESDLVFGSPGLEMVRLIAAFTYALGALPVLVPAYPDIDAIWRDIKAEIDARRPLVLGQGIHSVTIRGYAEPPGRRIVYLNDPAAMGPQRLDLNQLQLGPAAVRVFKFPNRPAVARQEASVSTDSDRDGVVDFDETERFRTDPNNVDSDGDGVRDRQDIESGVFELEHQYGYAYNPTTPNNLGRDFDFDGLPTELDVDSDGGGCKDGEEDLNGDGDHNGSETGNFDQTDDVCGMLLGNVSYVTDAYNTGAPDDIRKEMHDRGVILVRLKPDPSNPESYIDNGSTYRYQGWARVEVDLGQGCILWGREVSRGSGPFSAAPQGAEIGAGIGSEPVVVPGPPRRVVQRWTMALGALADVPGMTSNGGCGVPPAAMPGNRTLSLPECLGVLQPPPAARPGARAAPASPALKTYRFNCHSNPNIGPGWTAVQRVSGFVRVR